MRPSRNQDTAQTEGVSSPQNLDRVAELDGVRGIAILLVMCFHFGWFPAKPNLLHHVGHELLGFGWCGVDLFFVLSGFLITGILLESKTSPNYFRTFYARRAVRILPLYYVAVLLFFQVVPPLSHFMGWQWTRVSSTEQLWYWLHISNWRTAFYPLIYPDVTHFWSLAIEEQFYLIWPAVVLLLSRRRLLGLCGILILLIAVARNLPAAQSLSSEYPNFLYRLTPFRMDSLLFGASAALIVRDSRWKRLAGKCLLPASVIGAAGVIASVAAAGTTSASSRAMTGFGYTSLSVSFTAAILYAIRQGGAATMAARLLRSGILTRFGKYSYAMYVVHAPLSIRTRFHVEGNGFLALLLTLVVGITATYLLALVSWTFVERPFLRLKSRFNY